VPQSSSTNLTISQIAEESRYGILTVPREQAFTPHDNLHFTIHITKSTRNISKMYIHYIMYIQNPKMPMPPLSVVDFVASVIGALTGSYGPIKPCLSYSRYRREHRPSSLLHIGCNGILQILSQKPSFIFYNPKNNY
jgi:hypothetical protein